MDGDRNRRNHRAIPHLPPRPKKPLTGYTLFLRSYFDQHQENDQVKISPKISPTHSLISSLEINLTPPFLYFLFQEERNLVAAAAEWRHLNPEQRNEFTTQVAEGKAQYEREFAAWKQLKKALQKPPTAYGLYIRQRWEDIRRAGGTDRDVTQIGKAASRDWANMAPENKRLYFDARQHMMKKYREHLGQLDHGGTVQYDWMTEAFKETQLYHETQAQLVPPPVADDDEEDDDLGLAMII